MTIHDEIRRHLDRDLFLLISEFPGEETPRTMFLSREVQEIVLEAATDRYMALVKAVLDNFVAGGFITVAGDPFRKPSSAILARVDPVELEVFSFRVFDPRPQIRVLGCFSERDTFVALSWNYRQDFNWNAERDGCLAEWGRLFNGIPPHSGANLNEYLSHNFDVV